MTDVQGFYFMWGGILFALILLTIAAWIQPSEALKRQEKEWKERMEDEEDE